MKHPPYHLRTNKAVDRLLLVDLIRELKTDYKQCTYYSLAGPFLEDLRVMDHFFPEMQLVSLESNEQTYKRQKFHQFNSRVQLENKTLSNFLVRDYVAGAKDIFWLDYTGLNYPNFEEFQVVLRKVPPGSIVRITLRAEPEIDLESLENRVSDEEIDRLRYEFGGMFDKEFARVLPHSGVDAFAGLKAFARMVQLMIQRASSIALDTAGSKVGYLPVQSTRYNDNTQMLSVTGIVCLRNEMGNVRQQLKSVRFADFDWNEPTLINIPALSVKERLHLERHLPVQSHEDAGELLFKELQYKIDDSEKRSKQQLSHYADYHRDYPNFVRISV